MVMSDTIVTDNSAVIATLNERIAELELQFEQTVKRIHDLQSAIIKHKIESQEMKDYTTFPAYNFANTKLWQVIE
jgi:hypothetical protein